MLNAVESRATGSTMLKPDEELAYQLYKEATRATLKIRDPKIGVYMPWERLPERVQKFYLTKAHLIQRRNNVA